MKGKATGLNFILLLLSGKERGIPRRGIHQVQQVSPILRAGMSSPGNLGTNGIILLWKKACHLRKTSPGLVTIGNSLKTHPRPVLGLGISLLITCLVSKALKIQETDRRATLLPGELSVS